MDTHRLAVVASMIPAGSRVADVGAGHGLLPRRLLDRGWATHCIATEKTPERLRHVWRYPAGHRLAPALELRAGDGLQVLRATDRVDVLVIAGLGGRSIAAMLAEAPFDGRMVLQPQDNAAFLRRCLLAGGWAIVDERPAFERGRYYEILAAEPGQPTGLPDHPVLGLDELIAAGPWLVRSSDPLVRRFWSLQARRLEGILRGLPAGTAELQVRRERDRALRILSVLPS